jgi:hypothetical protein
MTERKYYEGDCVGGPLDQQHIRVRFPKGFLCVDRPAEKAWVYKFDGERFNASDEMVLDHTKRLVAAEDFDYDVVSI